MIDYDSGWLSFYDYFTIIGILRDKEFNRYHDLVFNGVWNAVLFENVCILSRLPTSVLKDGRGRLHSATKPCVTFRDDFSVYSIHGVRFEKDLWEKISQRKLSPKQVLEIQNIEQRRVAINHYGWDIIFDQLEATLTNKSKRNSKARLYRIKNLAPNIEINLVRYIDPSTGRQYVSQVPDNDDLGEPIKSADHAMAWKSWLTLEEYNELEIEA